VVRKGNRSKTPQRTAAGGRGWGFRPPNRKNRRRPRRSRVTTTGGEEGTRRGIIFKTKSNQKTTKGEGGERKKKKKKKKKGKVGSGFRGSAIWGIKDRVKRRGYGGGKMGGAGNNTMV